MTDEAESGKGGVRGKEPKARSREWGSQGSAVLDKVATGQGGAEGIHL